MAITISILILVFFLVGAGAGVFTMLVLGIHMDERRSKRSPLSRRTRVESATRRLLSIGTGCNPERDPSERS